jgi:hypothetical protein
MGALVPTSRLRLQIPDESAPTTGSGQAFPGAFQIQRPVWAHKLPESGTGMMLGPCASLAYTVI